VADIACGVGWASIALARAYPNAIVDGFDLDDSSIELARRYAVESGVADRVQFHVRDAADPAVAGPYDLAVVIEAIHDLSRPVEALASIRGILAREGCAIIADERTAETFTAPADPVEQLLYGISVLLCLPAAMAEQPSAATGTVIRPDVMRRYATEAGFASADVLDIDHPMLRFYRLRP
jgi:2-polyprenyl-3-methyl-5-hydroxy-6-metoxy-1,4-benzoquinol methylase